MQTASPESRQEGSPEPLPTARRQPCPLPTPLPVDSLVVQEPSALSNKCALSRRDMCFQSFSAVSDHRRLLPVCPPPRTFRSAMTTAPAQLPPQVCAEPPPTPRMPSRPCDFTQAGLRLEESPLHRPCPRWDNSHHPVGLVYPSERPRPPAAALRRCLCCAIKHPHLLVLVSVRVSANGWLLLEEEPGHVCSLWAPGTCTGLADGGCPTHPHRIDERTNEP